MRNANDCEITQDKYRLAREHNVFIAKKKLAENVYSGARMKGIDVTFAETQAIVDGVNVARLRVREIVVIHDLHAGWKQMLRHVDDPMTLDLVCAIHAAVSRAGRRLQNDDVSISGTAHMPPSPRQADVASDIDAILRAPTCATAKALELYAHCCKSQLFEDGNMRTACIVANHVLIANGCGLLTVGDRDVAPLQAKLRDYCDDDAHKSALLRFLYDRCVHRANFEYGAQKV